MSGKIHLVYSDPLAQVLEVMEMFSEIQDLDALLDRILLEARRLTNADAGSIFLAENDLLRFSYVHNNTLFNSPNNKYIYANNTIAINNDSLCGYVANTAETLLIDDVYLLPPSLPFHFNRSFDNLSGYRTKSILAIPLTTSQKKVVGVLEIINALDQAKNTISFTPRDQLVLNYFANHAAVAIERALMTRELILRMVKMCELRDPSETGAHANRVAAYTAEIYQKWASDRGVNQDEIKKNKDHLRIGAMLHDLGKVAISDTILKKPAKLTPEEFGVMKHHTILGARFFENSFSPLDKISAEIALNHHEKWDGSGYPGKIDPADSGSRMGPGKKGDEIPLFGRILALADVYDALISKRVYKDAMAEERVLEIIQGEAGKHFDPEVVETFFSIYEVIGAIRDKFT